MTETGEQDIDGNKEGQNDDYYGFLPFTLLPWNRREVSSTGDLKNYTSVLLSSVDCYVMCTISIVLFFRRKSLFIIAHFTSVYVKRNKSIKKRTALFRQILIKVLIVMKSTNLAWLKKILCASLFKKNRFEVSIVQFLSRHYISSLLLDSPCNDICNPTYMIHNSANFIFTKVLATLFMKTLKLVP